MVIEQYSSADVKELAKVMLRVQQELRPVQKDRKNTFTNSRYATLSTVMEACSSILIRHGIWLTQYPVPVEIGHLGLVT
ncbi:ERF superfamily protein, partial [Desulfobotulus alkaliphilus]